MRKRAYKRQAIGCPSLVCAQEGARRQAIGCPNLVCAQEGARKASNQLPRFSVCARGRTKASNRLPRFSVCARGRTKGKQSVAQVLCTNHLNISCVTRLLPDFSHATGLNRYILFFCHVETDTTRVG